MERWTVTNQGLDYTPEQVKENLERYRSRMTHVLQTHVDAARKLPWPKFIAINLLDRPMTKAWYNWCNKADIETVLAFWDLNVPEVVRNALGRPGRLTPDIIDELPDEWQTSLHGGYCDFVTMVDPGSDCCQDSFDEEDSGEEDSSEEDSGKEDSREEDEDWDDHIEDIFKDSVEFEPYTGSACGKHGLQMRCNHYAVIDRKKVRPKRLNRHEKLIASKRTRANIRVLFVIDPTSGHSALVSNGEQLFASYIGCHGSTKTGRYRTSAATKICKAALPRDFLPQKHRGLNDAIQMLQGITWRRKDRRCHNEDCRATKTKSWWLVDSGLPYGPRYCNNCGEYRKRTGTVRPKSLIDKTNELRAKRKAAGFVRSNGPAGQECANPNCTVKPRPGLWRLSQKVGGKWTCQNCFEHAERQKGVWNDTKWRQPALQDLRAANPKPRDEICENPAGCRKKANTFHAATLRWICQSCYSWERSHGGSLPSASAIAQRRR